MTFCKDELEVCGNLDTPGACIEVSKYVDYSEMHVTEDQQRIAEYLYDIVTRQDSILHVGIGNSDFASQFTAKVNSIDGLTVSKREKQYAQSLKLPNYQVFLLSKHAREVLLKIQTKYDYIIDNNLPSFACCRYHFFTMMDNYLWALKSEGRIITDEFGLGWACTDPSFVMNFQGLVELEKSLPIKVTKLTDMVISIEKNTDIVKHPTPTKSYRLCHRGGFEVIEPRYI